jgi:phage baseplate assembly protein W
MALQISRAFRDISLSFSKNPVTDDIIILRNEDAIKKSVTNLVRTRIGERFFNGLLGSTITNQLFELNLLDNITYLENEIRVLLENFEPRIRVSEVLVESVEDSNEINVNVVYDIVGLPFPQQNIEFLLLPART